MGKEFLESCLAAGMSLDEIGALVDRHPSTVSYHLKKHGLTPVGQEIHAPNGRVDSATLQALVDDGRTIRAIAAELGVGYSTVRHWLTKLGLESRRQVRKREIAALRRAGMPRRALLHCQIHGETAFVLRSNKSGYRCDKCAKAAVANRRRVVKRTLVDEFGGRCMLCGYDASIAALHFHHLDPATKSFGLSRDGVSRSLRKAREEASKCVLLCSNCHAEVEHDAKELPPEIVAVKSQTAGGSEVAQPVHIPG